MKIKLEHLDLYVSHPATGKTIWLRELSVEEYSYFYGHGYEWIFESQEGQTLLTKYDRKGNIKN